jgi:type II secretory pathway pseudopilin PulG
MVVIDDLRARQDGVTLAELMAALAILIVLVAIAIPTFSGVSDQARDAEATSELRTVLSTVKLVNLESPAAADLDAEVLAIAPGTKLDAAATAGVKLQRSADGAVCMWRISESGAVFGIWEPPESDGITLFAEIAALPADCPIAPDAAAAGFGVNPW